MLPQQALLAHTSLEKTSVYLFAFLFHKPWVKVPAVKQISDRRTKAREVVWLSGQGDSLQRHPYACQETEEGNDPATQNPTAAGWELFFQLVRWRKGHGANRRRENRSTEKGMHHRGNLSQVKMAGFSLYENLM